MSKADFDAAARRLTRVDPGRAARSTRRDAPTGPRPLAIRGRTERQVFRYGGAGPRRPSSPAHDRSRPGRFIDHPGLSRRPSGARPAERLRNKAVLCPGRAVPMLPRRSDEDSPGSRPSRHRCRPIASATRCPDLRGRSCSLARTDDRSIPPIEPTSTDCAPSPSWQWCSTMSLRVDAGRLRRGRRVLRHFRLRHHVRPAAGGGARRHLPRGLLRPADPARILPAPGRDPGAHLARAYWLLLPAAARGLRRERRGLRPVGGQVYFWRSSGYFDAAALYRPLLHTWSLSVEEQFYFCCRFADCWRSACACGRSGSRRARRLASFGLSLYAGRFAPTANFYLLRPGLGASPRHPAGDAAARRGGRAAAGRARRRGLAGLACIAGSDPALTATRLPSRPRRRAALPRAPPC